ncbi:MAG: glycosyltransferase family 4 protein, partial [Candidatus Aenigmarchaeota archaeon]|nr:glycosyltransferase family 4 protein [Candidatus Aenigmarchaeota archaeon]
MAEEAMKILHVCNHFHPCIGGMEKYVQGVCKGLAERGHRNDVACLDRCAHSNNCLPSRGRLAKTQIYRLPFVDLRFYKICPSVLRLVKGYDIINVHGIGFFSDFLILTSLLHRKKIILTTHGGVFHTSRGQRLKSLYFNLVQHLLLRHCKAIIAVSRNDMRIFGRPANLSLIQEGIDYGKFATLRNSGNALLYIGRLAANKRLDRLIQAFSVMCRILPEAKLFIAGPGQEDLVRRLKAVTAQNGLQRHVFFCGSVSEKQKLRYMRMSRFFVSASEYEGFGIALV